MRFWGMLTRQPLTYLIGLKRELHHLDNFGRNLQVIECMPKSRRGGGYRVESSVVVSG
ncbi:hypothetical protein Gogos_021243 [Gossypium gossypioides]|uniref:Uncharacterized protein n=1 Tax=Gossypium gossypioides TaxID=34282 RepID=A0A7J9CYK4_GOSGO|nr:hypothetical protein [Gossypium gossypioides]